MRLRIIRERFGPRRFTLLDAGSGNAPSLTKYWLLNCVYHGIDVSRDHRDFDRELKAMDVFYQLDLTQLNFDGIPDGFYDVVMASHVIEHLPNGDVVLERLIPKLKTGGVMYVEFPGPRSTRLPSMKGTLNFYDDPTHCRVFSVEEVKSILERNGLKILKAGTCRDWRRIVLLPLSALSSKIKLGYVAGSVLWDFFGFAEYVYAERP